MPIEKQLTNLELSLKLQSLGVPQESAFVYWTQNKNKLSIRHKSGAVFALEGSDFAGFLDEDKYVSAFTSDEHGEALPYIIKKVPEFDVQEESFYLSIERTEEGWSVKYTYYFSEEYFSCEADTLANAMAKMRIYLLENGLITSNTK